MTFDDLIASGAILVPWPTAIAGKVLPGQRIQTSGVCVSKCGATPLCHATEAPLGESLCTHGLSYFRASLAGERVTLFGVRSELSKATGSRHLKEALKGRTVTQAEVDAWAATMERLLASLAADFIRRQAEMLEPLHDPMRLVRQIYQLSSSIALSTTRTQNLEDALDRASADIKSLVKAADFLNESFDMLTIYFNPEAASFPKRYDFSLYGMLKKIVSMFSIADDSPGGARLPTIYLNGNSFRTVKLRENFKLVPFALITNAIKYTMDGTVRVTITDRAQVTEVAVESVGPPIEPDEIGHIFGKKFRGKWAQKHSSGTGVGLYLADAVAKANGFVITASSVRNGRKNGEMPLAVNRFWFEVPSRESTR